MNHHSSMLTKANMTTTGTTGTTDDLRQLPRRSSNEHLHLDSIRESSPSVDELAAYPTSVLKVTAFDLIRSWDNAKLAQFLTEHGQFAVKQGQAAQLITYKADRL
jgi:hypothetical protein